MTTKEAKEILENHVNGYKLGYTTVKITGQEITEALDVAIQCLEDSIEGVKEAVDDVNKKLEIKRTCRHPKNKVWVLNGETFCDVCNQYLI
jgi:hypothetical protein